MSSASTFTNWDTSKLTKTLTISSGKGGVGKTTLVSNIALSLANEGKKILILDGDLGMSNVDLMFGKQARTNILSSLTNEIPLEECLVELHPNISLLSGGSGLKELQKISDFQRRLLLDQITNLPVHYDYLIIDTAPGIDDNVLYLNSCVQERNIIVSPDPASLTDSYALIKVLNKQYKIHNFSIITNFVKNEDEGLSLYRRLSDVTEKFLNVSLDFKGSILMDSALRHATKSQKLVVEMDPHAPSSLGIKKIAKNLNNANDIEMIPGGMKFFWNHLLGVA